MILSGLVSDDIKTVSELNQSFYQNARHSTRALAPKLPDSGRLSRISKRFPGLTSLDLSKGGIQNALIIDALPSSLSNLQHLTSLRLSRLPLTSNQLETIAESTNRIVHLDLRACSSVPFKRLGSALKSLHHLKTLNCSGSKQSSSLTLSELEADKDLCKLIEKLETLILGDCMGLSWIDDKICHFIGSHKKSLVHLDLSGCIDISDQGLMGLCSGIPSGPNMRTLSLQSCVRITNEGFVHAVSNFKHLERLNVKGCPQISDQGFRQLSSLASSLVELDLSSTSFSSSSLSVLSHSLKRLKRLTLSNCSQITSLEGVQHLIDLQELNLYGCSRLPLQSLSSLSSLTFLQVLNASKLKAPPSLINSSSNDQPDGLEMLSGLTSLVCFRLSSNKSLPKSLLCAISNMLSLEILAMDSCSCSVQVDDKKATSELWFLESLEHLSVLDLSGWRQANPSSLSSLSHLKQLTAVKLQRMGNDFFRSRIDNPSQPSSTSMFMSNEDAEFDTEKSPKSQIKTQEVAALQLQSPEATSASFDMTWVKGLSNLQVLDLEACTGITDACFESISSLPSLKHLNLSGCIQLQALHLNSSLPSKLESLLMDDCPMLTIQSPSESPLTLKSLSVKRCPLLDDESLQVISRSLPALISLHLFSSPKISIKGVESIASSLKRVTELSLIHCWNLSTDALDALKRDLPCLVHLNLAHCWKMTQAALEGFRESRSNVELVV